MKYYDFFVPMGSFCSTSYHLRHNDLQTEAYPLDWVIIWKIKQAAELITSNFEGFFLQENLEFKEVSGNHNSYTDTKNNIVFLHCIDKDLPFNEGYLKAKDTFNRRIERLYERINQARKVLFVYAINESISHEEALDAYDILKNKYPYKQFDLLVLDLKPDYKDTKYEDVSPNIIFAKMRFDWYKDTYTGRKEGFAEIFANYQIASVKKRTQYLCSKFINYIKRLIVSLICCFIPSKDARKKLRRKFKTDKLLFDK